MMIEEFVAFICHWKELSVVQAPRPSWTQQSRCLSSGNKIRSTYRYTYLVLQTLVPAPGLASDGSKDPMLGVFHASSKNLGCRTGPDISYNTAVWRRE